MAYVFLAGAILAEVFGTSLLKATEGFTRPLPTVALFAAYVASFASFSRSVNGASKRRRQPKVISRRAICQPSEVRRRVSW